MIVSIKNTEDTETSEKGMSVCCLKINSVYSGFSVLKNSLVSFKFLRKLKNLQTQKLRMFNLKIKTE